MIRAVLKVLGIVTVASVVVSCAGPGAATDAPTQPVPTQTSAAPASTPAAPPTLAPAEAPTEAPAVEPTPTTPRETVAFNWAPGSVPPSDADDVEIILTELRTHEGISGGSGDETILNVFYDPTVITVEEIMELLRDIGHPVVLNE